MTSTFFIRDTTAARQLAYWATMGRGHERPGWVSPVCGQTSPQVLRVSNSSCFSVSWILVLLGLLILFYLFFFVSSISIILLSSILFFLFICWILSYALLMFFMYNYVIHFTHLHRYAYYSLWVSCTPFICLSSTAVSNIHEQSIKHTLQAFK